MRRVLRRLSVVVAVLSMMSGPSPSWATRWQEVGEKEATGDKIYIDLDSIKFVEGLRIVSVRTVYPEPRVNDNGILMDSHMQVTALDCSGGRFIGIRTVGYLGPKRAGTSPETPAWRTKLVPVASGDALSLRTFNLACAAPLGAGEAMGGQSGPPSPGGAPGGATIGAPAPVAKVSAGSGIFVNDGGYVLTNAHVVNGCKVIVVKALGAPPTGGTLEAYDPKNDLALVKTASGYGQPAIFRVESRPARLGENIAVIGYPLPGVLSTEPKATFGQVNSVAGMNNDYAVLQISAPVQPGNSGGPVFDEAGQVIGVVVSQASTALGTAIGIMPQNVNFAIRGELAQIFMTAHGVPFTTDGSHRRLRTEDLAATGERVVAQIVCSKS